MAAAGHATPARQQQQEKAQKEAAVGRWAHLCPSAPLCRPAPDRCLLLPAPGRRRHVARSPAPGGCRGPVEGAAGGRACQRATCGCHPGHCCWRLPGPVGPVAAPPASWPPAQQSASVWRPWCAPKAAPARWAGAAWAAAAAVARRRRAWGPQPRSTAVVERLWPRSASARGVCWRKGVHCGLEPGLRHRIAASDPARPTSCSCLNYSRCS